VALPTGILVPPQVGVALFTANDDVLTTIAIYVGYEGNVDVFTRGIGVDYFVAEVDRFSFRR